MYKTTLAAWLMKVADAYAAHNGVSTTFAMNRVTGDAQLFYRLNGGAGFKVVTYDRWMQQFSDAWPEGCAWPAAVLRPEPIPATAVAAPAPAQAAE